jgi:hypothetical protein
MMDNIILLIFFILVIGVFLVFGIFLHKQRKYSSIATDFFQKKLSSPDETNSNLIEMEGITNGSSSNNAENEKIVELLSDRDKQRKIYRELIELFKNRKPFIDAEVTSLEIDNNEELITTEELSYLLGLDIDSTINLLINKELIEDRFGVLFLTDNGSKIGKYVHVEDKIIIRWEKNSLLKSIAHLEQIATTFAKNSSIKSKLNEFWNTLFVIIFWGVVLFFIFGK